MFLFHYQEPEIIKIEDFNVRRVNTYKDVEELAIDTYMVCTYINSGSSKS